MKILAVVVTHNRCELLRRCLSGLQHQTRAPDKLLVINNDSTDGTEEMLRAEGVPFVTQPNVGSAGGWHRGIEAAVSGGFGAVWLMDDDGFPDAEALRHLEAGIEDGTVACAASIVLQEDDRGRFVFPFPVLGKDGLPVLFRWPRKVATLRQLSALSLDGRYPFAHLFNGALVSVAAIRAIGNVERDYFIFGEEVDYFFRLREVGTVLSILNARHYHPDVGRRPYTPIKVYYYVKNTLILNRRYMDNVVLRDVLTILAVVGRTFRRNGLWTALSYVLGGQSNTLYRAIQGGLTSRLGRDFDA